MTQRPPRRPRVPTALLAVATVVALVAAAWLFLGGDSDGGSGSGTDTAGRDREQVEGVLDLPEEEEPTDSRRRGGDGRDRLDDPDGDPVDDDATDEGDEDLPAIAANLAGLRIALGTGSAAAPGNVARRVAIGALRVRCADAVDPALQREEAAVVEALTALVERAGGTVVRSDDPPACVDERARRLHRGTLGVVVSAHEGRLAVPGRAARGSVDVNSRTLATVLAAALDLDPPPRAALIGARRRATSGGAIDLPGSAAVAWVEFDSGVDEAGVDELARALLQGLAATAARADVSPG